jgi:hypothetical protein
MNSKQSDDQYSEKEAATRRDATIKRMIAMPPKPHSEMKVGKRKGKTVASPKRAFRKSQAK